MMLKFVPFLALVACLSFEVTAQTYNTYKSLADYTNKEALDYDIVSSGGTGAVTIANSQLCSHATVDAGTCPATPATWDRRDTVVYSLDLPAASELEVAPGVGLPTQYKLAVCYGPSDVINRKWRKFKDVFADDKSCLFKTDFIEYPSAGFTGTQMQKLKSTMPKGTFTTAMFVKCANQGSDQFCYLQHTFNTYKAATNTNPVFFPANVMDSRGDDLYAAVFVAVCVGPALFIAFLIYERCYLARKAA